MKRALILLAAVALLIAVAMPAMAQDRLEPIKKVSIGKNREFIVNGKPFLPIMSWLQSPRTYMKLRTMNFNTFCGVSKNVKQAADTARVAGGYLIPAFSSSMVGNSNVLAYIHGDEPDLPKGGKPRMTLRQLENDYRTIKKGDSTRPLLMTFTAHFMKSKVNKYDASMKQRIYPKYVKFCDVVGFDTYPIYGSGMPGNLCDVAKGVTELRALAGPKRPVYAWIETSKGSKWMTYEKQLDVLPIHTRAEVWMALIRGATSIGYFTHAWRPTFKEFAPTAEMQTELKRLNGQITQLAPMLLAAPSKKKIEISISGGLDCHLKATEHKGFLYIFAQNLDLGPNAEKLRQFQNISPRSGVATITVPGLKAGMKAEVIGEDRSIVVRAGKFADQFGPLAEHVYRIRM